MKQKTLSEWRVESTTVTSSSTRRTSARASCGSQTSFTSTMDTSTENVAGGKFVKNISMNDICLLNSKDGLWYIWVYVLESETVRSSDYSCIISIISSDGEEELSCRCKPLSLDMTKEKIAESGRGLVFTDTTAR